MHYQKHVFVCQNVKAEGKKCCGAAAVSADEVALHIKSRLQAEGMHGAGHVRVSRSGCLGRCALGPCLVIYPEGIWYSYQSRDDIELIIEHHLLAGQPVPQLQIDPEMSNI